ncbi:MAG: carboxypeptidase-like regulatory domain-containing protein [Imperialibacter sp.]
MIKKHLILIIFLLVGSSFAWSQGIFNDTFVVEGTLLDKNDTVPVPFAHAYSMDYKRFRVSDEKGKFTIQLQRGDTLVISSIGYATRFFLFTDIPASRKIEHVIYMSQDPVELQGITIYGKMPMEGFYDHERIPYDKFKEKELEPGYYKPGLSMSPGGAGVSVGFSGALTLLAAQFNSEYQQLKKLDKIRKQEYQVARYEYFVKNRLSPRYVTTNTSLLTTEVDDFIKFWSPDTAFVEYANEYELVTALQEKEKQYIDQIKRNRGADEDIVSTIELRKLLMDKGNEE